MAASPELCILTEWGEGELIFGDKETGAGRGKREEDSGLDEWEGKHVWEIMEKRRFVLYFSLA